MRLGGTMALAVAGTGVLAACTGNGAAPATAPTAAPAAAPTPAGITFPENPQPGQKTVVWMTRTTNSEELKWESGVVLPAYNKARPDVFVKVIAVRDGGLKRDAMIAAGEPLHVWSPNWGGNGFASDHAHGYLQDLTQFIARDKFDTSDILPSALKAYQSGGKQYGLPLLTTGSYVFYNKKLFDEAGVSYPTTDWDDSTWTWDKYVETAKKLTKNTDNPDKAVYGSDAALFGNLEGPPMLFGKSLWSESAYNTGYSDDITVTDTASVQAFQALHDLIYKDKVAPDPATTQAMAQLGGPFASGRVAMSIAGGFLWNWYKFLNDPNGFTWGIAPLPMGTPDAKTRAVIYTDPWTITSGMNQENIDLAWDFLKFLTSMDQQQAYLNAMGTPPVRASLSNAYYKVYEKGMPADKMMQVFQGAFSHGRESSNHLIVGSSQLSQTWSNDLSSFWTDPNAQAKDALKTVENDVNAALQQIRSQKK